MNQHSDLAAPAVLLPDYLRLIFWGLGICLLAGVMTVCLIPLKLPPAAPQFNDKFLHLTTFAMLMLWFGGLVSRERHWQLALALMGYGLLIEVLQSFTAYRSAEWLDSLADGLGILAGWLLLRLGAYRWPLLVAGIFSRRPGTPE